MRPHPRHRNPGKIREFTHFVLPRFQNVLINQNDNQNWTTKNNGRLCHEV